MVAGITSTTSPAVPSSYWDTPAGQAAAAWYTANPGAGAAQYVAAGQPGGGGGGGGGGPAPRGPNPGVATPPVPAASDPYWGTPAGKLAKRWYDAHPGMGAAEYVSSGQYARDQAAVAAGDTGDAPFNPFAPGERQAFAGRKLDDIKAGGGFTSMTPQEMQYYLGGLPTGDPNSLSAFLGLNGINTGTGNPWAETAESFIQPAAMAAAMQLYGGNAGTTALGEQGPGQLAKNLQDRFAGGHASFFDPEGSRAFIDSIADMVDRYSNKADSVGVNQGAVGAFLNQNPDNAFNAWMDVQGMNLNPFMQFRGTREGLKKSLYKQYYQQQAPSNPNQNYWRFLANVGR